MNDWFGVGILFLLVLLNGFFVAVEYALVSVRHTRIDQLAEAGSGAARTVQRVLAHLDQYIAAVQLGVSQASGTPSAVNSGCERCSMAGSAIKPISRLIMLTPSCTAAMY